MSNQENFTITYDFEVKGDSQVAQSVAKAVQAVDRLNKANEASAQAFKVAERAGLQYSESVKGFVDKSTNAMVNAEQAAKRLAKANQELQQKGGGLDKGDLFDIAGNLGVGGEALGLFRDLTTSSGALGAGVIAASAAVAGFNELLNAQVALLHESQVALSESGASVEEYSKLVAENNKTLTALFADTRDVILALYSNFGAGELTGLEGAIKTVDDAKARAATADFVAGRARKEAAEGIDNEVYSLIQQGKTFDEVLPKLYEYNKLTRTQNELTAITPEVLKKQFELRQQLLPTQGVQTQLGGLGEVKQGQQQITKAQIDYRAQQQAQADAASAIATKLRGQLIDLQNQSNEAIENLAEQHQKRLASIAQNGASQRANIESNYAKQLENLAANLQEQRENIVSQNTERIVELEKQTQESRSKAIEDYAKRNGDIETAYQERIKAIQQNYSDNLFDIEARRDARALVAARKSRDKDIRDAEASREKDKKQAQDDYQTNQRNLETALKKQIETIRNDQAKRLEEAQNAYQKQLSAAQKARAEQLQALTRSLAEQRTAENRGYQESLTALQQQFANRRTALIQALASEANLTTEYGRKVIESLKGILNPREISDAIKQFQNAVNAKVTVKIEPITPVSNTSPSGTSGAQNAGSTAGYSYAEGGYIPSARFASLHANEVVLPLSNPARTQQLLKQYVAPRAGVMRQEVTGRIMVDGSAVDAAMKSQLSSELTRIFSEALTASNRG